MTPSRALLVAALAAFLVAAGCSEGGRTGAVVDESAGTGTEEAAPPPPRLLAAGAVDNVVLITIDTLRADALGFGGGAHRASTPLLDRLAAAGRVYRDAHAHNVVTLPSHANILTGLYPYQHGIRDNSGFTLPPAVPTIATHLATAGFTNAAFVAAFALDARYGLGRAFSVYDDRYAEGDDSGDFVVPERPGTEVVPPAVDWWRANAGRRRFLWLHLYDPHAPYDPPQPFRQRHPESPYLGEVAAVDAYLEPLLASFLEGKESPTLIVFTADHGEALGAHGELTHGFFAYEQTLEVPLVLWAPGLPAGATDEHARHVDLLPTILEAAGVPVPPGLPGRSLLQPMPDAARLPSYFEALSPNLNRGWAPLRGMLRDGFKFVSLPLPELYDLANDPRESLNLVEQDRRRAGDLAVLLPSESAWPPPRADVSLIEQERLRALGYLAESAEAKETYTAEDDPKNLIGLDNKLHEVIDLYQRGRLEEAERLAREVVEARHDMALGYSYLARILLQRERVPEAIEVMRLAVARGAADPPLLRQLGLSLAEVGKPGEAIPLLEPLAASDDPDVLNALGLVLSEASRQEEARRTLERVFARDPRNPVAHQHLALVALRRQDWAEAERQAEACLALNPALGLAWNYLGSARYNLGRPQEALEAWERSVETDPRGYDALYNLAVVALEVRDLGRARRALVRFVETAPPARYAPDIEKARGWLRGITNREGESQGRD